MRRARARLIDIDDELIAQTSGEDLVARSHDRARNFGIEATERGIGLRSSFLHQDGRRDEIGRRAEAADGEVFDGARSLDAVVRIHRHFQLAKRIAFSPIRHWHMDGIRDLGFGIRDSR